MFGICLHGLVIFADDICSITVFIGQHSKIVFKSHLNGIRSNSDFSSHMHQIIQHLHYINVLSPRGKHCNIPKAEYRMGTVKTFVHGFIPCSHMTSHT